MKKILWFSIKEPFEKLVDKILKAKDEKSKIEFTTRYIQSTLGEKQLEKFINWMEENKDWLKDKTKKETDFDRLQRKMPIGCIMQISSRVPLVEYIVFNFS